MPPLPSTNRELLKGPDGAAVVYLLDTATDLEAGLLGRWLDDEVGKRAEIIRIASSRRGRGGDAARLTERMSEGDDPYLVPLRVVWMTPDKEGRRSVGWSDIFKPGDPRDPRGLRAFWIRTFSPSRVRLTAALGASSSDLKAAYEASGEIDGIGPYVTRRAWRVLDQVERALRGNRYKIPRFVPEAILSRREFIETVDTFAAEAGISGTETRTRAERYLREIAATHSAYVIDLVANAVHALYRQGYGEIKYDPEEVTRVAELGQHHPVVFLPSHRSNMDRLSLQFLLLENDLPPNHTAGGINLDFFPVGPLIRRTGVFFIRRSFRDDYLYKIVLRAYIDYLVEKRFPIEWYMEGGRSRSGKLNPPRYGLLNYVVDSLRRGKAGDIQLIPVSIAYDHIQDVPDYAREALGKGKEAESLVWLIRAVRSLRKRYGDIHVRFGEPVSVSSVLVSIEPGEEPSVGLQKLGFEVMHRIGKVTPITPTAMVSIALLASRGRARTAAQLAEDCAWLGDFIRARGLPTTEGAGLDHPTAVTAVLDWLAEHGNVSSHEALGRRVFWLDDEQMIRISYYRNVVVHFFVTRAIAELALASLIEENGPGLELLRRRTLELRDLLKFEFFFPEKERFLAEIAADMAVEVPDWEKALEATGASDVLTKMGPRVGYWALLPFLDAYQVVGDELEALEGPFDERGFLKACLARARMYLLEERLVSGESASQVLFKSALALAGNRGLLGDAAGVAERRRGFAAEVRAARRWTAEAL